MSTCNSCGAEVSSVGVFCPRCGAALRAAPASESPVSGTDGATNLPEDLPTGLMSLNGRCGRGTYWAVTLITGGILGLVIFLAIVLIAGSFWSMRDSGSSSPDEIKASFANVLTFLVVPATLLSGIICFPVHVRRWHDHGYSGWLAIIIALVGFIPLVGFLAGLVSFVFLGCLAGQPHANRYGRALGGQESAEDLPAEFVRENTVGLWCAYLAVIGLSVLISIVPALAKLTENAAS